MRPRATLLAQLCGHVHVRIDDIDNVKSIESAAPVDRCNLTLSRTLAFCGRPSTALTCRQARWAYWNILVRTRRSRCQRRDPKKRHAPFSHNIVRGIREPVEILSPHRYRRGHILIRARAFLFYFVAPTLRTYPRTVMPDSGKSDNPGGNGDREDIRWFENYERRNGAEHLAILRNKDILSYIKDIERNCRLEVSSGDEDHAGAKRSSNCSVRFSGTAVKLSKKPRSRVTSKKSKKPIASRGKQIVRSYNRNIMDASCAYCCASQKSRLRYAPTYEENSGRGLNVSVEPAYRYSRSLSEQNLRSYRAVSSPRFHGRYFRKSRRIRPADTETTSFEMIEDRSVDVSPDCRVERSRGRRSSAQEARTFKSLRGRRFKLNERSDVANEFVNQQPLAEQFDLSRDMVDESTTRNYQILPRNQGYKGYKGHDAFGNRYRYPAKRFALSSLRGPNSRSNKPTASARPNTSTSISRSMSRKRTSWRRSQTAFPFEASASIAGPSIHGTSGRQMRDWRYENNSDQRPDGRTRVLQGSACRCKPYLANRQSSRLCELIRSRDAKRWLGCCCEDQDETVDCNEHCRCPENTRSSGPARSIGVSSGIDRAVRGRGFYETFSRFQTTGSRINDAVASDRDLSAGRSSPAAAAMYDEAVVDEAHPRERTRNRRGDSIGSESSQLRVPFANEWTYRARRSHEALREYEKSDDDTKSGRRGATEAPRREASREGIRRGEVRTLGRELASSWTNSPRWRRDATESLACECREAFHDRPAACLAGSCTCVKYEAANGESNSSSDSSHGASVCCCRCSSARSQDERDPVRKLESFCERVKAVNRDALGGVERPMTPGHGDEPPGQSEGESAQMAARRTLRRDERPERHRRANRDDTNLERFLIYPPRGAGGPPLTLYKRSSNINCRVKGDAASGFRYDVTYVQRFVSPTWMPDLSPRVPSREMNEKCCCAADHGWSSATSPIAISFRTRIRSWSSARGQSLNGACHALQAHAFSLLSINRFIRTGGLNERIANRLPWRESLSSKNNILTETE